MALTKTVIAEHLTKTVGLSRKHAKAFVESFFEEIKVSLEEGDTVRIASFGSFEIKDKAERPGRNPKTGEEVAILARRVVSFKAGQKLKKLVAEKMKDK
jgi:integration host factor subunit alpha